MFAVLYVQRYDMPRFKTVIVLNIMFIRNDQFSASYYLREISRRSVDQNNIQIDVINGVGKRVLLRDVNHI